MIAKKICMLGAYSVGKTSLVKRFVDSMFSEKYQTTLGVKIDKKIVTVGASQVQLMIWDIEGTDAFTSLRQSYLRGASGILFVVDGTRMQSLDAVLALHDQVQEYLGEVPAYTLLNKQDLSAHWVLDEVRIHTLESQGWRFLRTSAKTGDNVDAAFQGLAQAMTTADQT